jgi:uncharacterized protein YndB with AHSA1/START domain
LKLEVEHILAAGRTRVFTAFTTAQELAHWWGPEGFTIPSIDFDPRVGCSYRIEMQPPEGERFFLAGVFRTVEPPDRLAFTFVWEHPDPDDVETLADLSFRDLGESTKVVLRQGPFKTEARRDLHRDGWTDTFEKLGQRLTR